MRIASIVMIVTIIVAEGALIVTIAPIIAMLSVIRSVGVVLPLTIREEKFPKNGP